MANVAKVKAPTKKEKYAMAIEMAKAQGNDMLVEFFETEIEHLNAKSSKGNAKKNAEQEAFMDVLRDAMSELNAPSQCGAIAKCENVLAFQWADGKATSPQRVSAILKKMIENGDVIKTEEKGVSYFALA